MISNPNLIFYACIARGSTILAEFSSSKEPGIQFTAQRCIDKTPSHHSLFSHTARKRTYRFLINDPFVYFVVFDAGMEKSESLWFLNRLKNDFEEFWASNSIADFDKLSPLCFQGEFHPIFREILGMDLEAVNSLEEEESKDEQNPSLDSSIRDSSRGKKAAVKPLLWKPSKVWFKKKKRLYNGFGGEANGDHHVKDGDCEEEDALRGSNLDESGSVVVSRDFAAVSMVHKSGGVYLVDSRQKAKQIWRKHVWVVLILDLIVCVALFGIWLWVCRGFQCIDG